MARYTDDKTEATHRHPVVRPTGDGYLYMVAESDQLALNLSGREPHNVQRRLASGLWDWLKELNR